MSQTNFQSTNNSNNSKRVYNLVMTQLDELELTLNLGEPLSSRQLFQVLSRCQAIVKGLLKFKS